MAGEDARSICVFALEFECMLVGSQGTLGRGLDLREGASRGNLIRAIRIVLVGRKW